MPSSDNFAPNNVWASATPENAEEELTLPSGQTCRARRMSIEGVIQAGLIDQLDSLTGVVDGYTRQVKGGKGIPDGTPVIDDALLKDTAALTAIIGMVDDLVPHIVVSPKVVPHWSERVVGKTKVRKLIPVTDREPGVVYTDMIGLDDKMHLFDWALGGLEAFSSFRRDPDSHVGNVAPRQGDRGKAKRGSRRRPR